MADRRVSPLPDGYFRSIVDALPVVVCRWQADTTLTYANQLYRELMADGEDVVGRRWLEFVPDEQRSHVESFYREVARDPRTVTFEHAVEDAAGVRRLFAWTDQPVMGSNGEAATFQSLGLDITAQRTAETQRRRLEEQLHHAHEIEALGRLAAGVAHDFNNILGVILGRAEMALGTVEPDSEAAVDLLEIKDAAVRSADLTRQLLTFARRQPIRPVPTDLNAHVQGMLRLLKRLVGNEIELRWEPTPTLWPIEVDPTQLDQVLMNLTVNARDAIVSGGSPPTNRGATVSIRTWNASLPTPVPEADPGPDPEDRTPGDYVVLSVSDTGTGMNEAIRDRIFEPFFTTKALGHGTGLGLATVYGMVKQNAGHIDVRSAPEKGSTFELYFPRSQAE